MKRLPVSFLGGTTCTAESWISKKAETGDAGRKTTTTTKVFKILTMIKKEKLMLMMVMMMMTTSADKGRRDRLETRAMRGCTHV